MMQYYDKWYVERPWDRNFCVHSSAHLFYCTTTNKFQIIHTLVNDCWPRGQHWSEMRSSTQNPFEAIIHCLWPRQRRCQSVTAAWHALNGLHILMELQRANDEWMTSIVFLGCFAAHTEVFWFLWSHWMSLLLFSVSQLKYLKDVFDFLS